MLKKFLSAETQNCYWAEEKLNQLDLDMSFIQDEQIQTTKAEAVTMPNENNPPMRIALKDLMPFVFSVVSAVVPLGSWLVTVQNRVSLIEQDIQFNKMAQNDYQKRSEQALSEIKASIEKQAQIQREETKQLQAQIQALNDFVKESSARK